MLNIDSIFQGEVLLVAWYIFAHDKSPSTAVRRNYNHSIIIRKSKYLLCESKLYIILGEWNLKFHFRYFYNLQKYLPKRVVFVVS